MTRANDITEAAAKWLIRLECQTSPDTWDAFQAWIDEDVRHRATFVRLRVAWNRADLVKNVRPVDGTIDANLLTKSHISADTVAARAAQPVTDRLRPRPRTIEIPGRRRLLAVAALGAVGFFVWLGIRHDGWSSFETPVGTHKAIRLTDSSIVDLNTNTDLRVRISQTRRDLVLLRGEALFHVAHDAARPFYVDAGGTIVRAVGTTFSVRIEDSGHIEVLVTEGRVAIGAAGSATNLNDSALLSAAPKVSADESASVAHGSVVVRSLDMGEVPRRLAWIDGHLAFQGETLTEAVRQFNRYNQRQITIADPAIGAVRVGGIFLATDPNSFVAALRRSFGIRSQSTNDTADIRLSGSERPPG